MDGESEKGWNSIMCLAKLGWGSGCLSAPSGSPVPMPHIFPAPSRYSRRSTTWLRKNHTAIWARFTKHLSTNVQACNQVQFSICITWY
ncbi:Uncharacterized protein HZ326_29061 [Fusarium oxysporum f. sp. albedinis]|nr:Uncharacterized protein HZ326_29061 [Fusarium oxysporum f. sp. albedinis]